MSGYDGDQEPAPQEGGASADPTDDYAAIPLPPATRNRMSWNTRIVIFAVVLLGIAGWWTISRAVGRQGAETRNACDRVQETFNRWDISPDITSDQQASDVATLLTESTRATPALQDALAEMKQSLDMTDNTRFYNASTDIINACKAVGH